MTTSDAASRESGRPQVLVLVLAALFALSHGAAGLVLLLGAGDALRVVDFASFHYAADAAFNHGLSPYAPETIARYERVLGHRVYPFLYPPASLPLFWPLALLDYRSGAGALLAVNMALAAALFVLIHRTFLARIRGRAAYAGAVLLLLLFDAVRQTIGLGQINLVPAVAALAAWVLLRGGRRPFLAGVLLGLAVLAKLYFAVFLLPLLLRMEPRPLAGAGIVLLAAISASLMVLPAALWSDWAAMAAARGSFGHLPFPEHPLVGTWNQSLNGVATRILGPGTASAGIGLALAFLVAAVAAWRLWRSRALAARDFHDGAFVLLSGTLLLVAPIAWTHHLVVLAAPLACLWARGEMRRAGAGMAVLFGILAALLAARWPLPALYGIAPALASLPFLAILAFWVFCLTRAALPWRIPSHSAYLHAHC